MRPGYAAVVGMLQPLRGAVQQLGLAPAERPGPGRIDRLPDAVAVGDQQQILRHVPDPVALAGFFLDPFGQRGVQLRQFAGDQFLVVHVGVGADPPDDVAMLVARRHRAREKPAVRAFGAAQAKFDLVGFAAADRPRPGGDRAWNIVGVDDLAPLLAVEFAGAGAGIFIDARIEPVEKSIRARGPHMMRQRFGQRAEFLFALPQRALGLHLFGDIAMRADQTHGLAVLIALDGGLDGNPAQLAVAWPDDPVLHGVFAHRACDGVAEFLFGGFAVVRVNALHPVFVGLVGGIRRQPVDQQIFRRTAVAEAGAQIDLEAADAADLLHARKFGLALAQRNRRKMLLGDVAAYHEDAADAVAFIDRAVAVGPPDLFEPAVTRDRHQLVLMPGGAAAAHHLFDLGTDDGPDFGPAVAAALAERARVPLRTHGLAVGVVIELDQLRTPPDEHRVVGVEQDAHRRSQALRPGFRRPDRGRGPVVRARQCAHLPAAGEKIRIFRSVEIQHSDDRRPARPYNSSRNLTACHTRCKRSGFGLVPIYFRNTGTKCEMAARRYFIRPAAVRARVMTAPTSIAGRRGGRRDLA